MSFPFAKRAALLALITLTACDEPSVDAHAGHDVTADGVAGDAAPAQDSATAQDTAPAADATPGADAPAQPDDVIAAEVADTTKTPEPSPCAPACKAGQVCCPDAHGHFPQCVAGTACP